MIPGIGRRLGRARFAVVGGLIALVSSGCGSSGSSEEEERGCAWERRVVEQDERTAVLDKTVAELGQQFHVGEAWSCQVSWAAVNGQSEAVWSPANEEVEASLSFGWGERAEEVTGRAPSGTRLACIAHLDIGLTMSFRANDGSLTENWGVVGTYTGGDELVVEVLPRELGGYQGSYSIQWLSELPELGSTLRVVLRPEAAVGGIVEWTARIGGNSGEGVAVSPAAWTCER